MRRSSNTEGVNGVLEVRALPPLPSKEGQSSSVSSSHKSIKTSQVYKKIRFSNCSKFGFQFYFVLFHGLDTKVTIILGEGVNVFVNNVVLEEIRRNKVDNLRGMIMPNQVVKNSSKGKMARGKPFWVDWFYGINRPARMIKIHKMKRQRAKDVPKMGNSRAKEVLGFTLQIA